MDATNSEMSENTEKEKTLLEQIIEKELRHLIPIVGMKGIIYKDIEDIIGELSWPEVRKILESLAKKGAFHIKETHFALFCPTCNSMKVFSKYVCSNCRSDNINQIKLIEHSLCGYTGLIEEFDTGTNYVCPNCKVDFGDINGKPLGDESKGDFKVIGISFECMQCNSRFDRPDMIHICQNCDRVFDYKNADYGKYYEFDIPEETILSLRRGLGIKVLLVEDNPEEAVIIMKALIDEGKTFSVEHVNTGEKAIEKFNETYYDIVLLDYFLPGTNGIEILRKIKENNSKIPVIMFTGADDREIAVEAMKLGASDYVLKSVELYKKLPHIIRQYVQSS
jgi:CheY-like chemotaxis protein